MTTSYDRELREALRRLAETPAPQGMAARAMRRARRQRRVGTAVGLAFAMSVVMAAVPLAFGVIQDGRGLETGQTWTAGPLVVTAYSGLRPTDAEAPEEGQEEGPVSGIEGTFGPITDRGEDDRSAEADAEKESQQKSLLLDPATGRYVEVPYRSALPSPDGTRVIVEAGADTPSDPLRTGVMDRASLKVRWIDGYYGEVDWSPDSREILMTVRSRLGPSGFAIIDAETLSVSFHDFDVYSNSMGKFVWAPNGVGIALTSSQSTEESSPDTVTGIRFFDRAGTLLRTVPASAPLNSTTDFSPDGTRMALHRYGSAGPIQIVDVETGVLRQHVPLPMRGTVVGWADDSHLVVKLWDADFRRELHVMDLAGNTTSVARLLDHAANADDFRVGSSAGLPSTAADLTF